MSMVSHLLNRTALWQRVTTSSNKGQHATTPITVDPALPCRVSLYNSKPSKAAGFDPTFGDENVSQNFFAIYCEPMTALQRNDLLTVEGTIYRVISSQAPSVPASHMKVLCEQVERAALLA
jgi:hypothetical protein